MIKGDFMEFIKAKFYETCKHIERYWNLDDRIDSETLNGFVTTKIYCDNKDHIAVITMMNGEYISLMTTTK